MSVRQSALLVLLLLGCAESATTQAPTFSTKLDAVRVDVLVTEKGQAVRGLLSTDFEILDNGVLQRVDLATFEQIPLNVILAVDLSESVAGERLDHLRGAGRALLDGLKGEDRAALLTFNHQFVRREGLTPNIERLRTALDRLEPRGDTALVDGAYVAMTLSASDVGRSLLILFSDGLDTSSWLSPDSVLDSARRSDVVAYSVSVRGRARIPFLQDLADLTGGAVFEIESTRDLSRTFVDILDEFRQRYLVSFSPQGVAKTGWHRLEVRVKGRKLTVKARAGYLAGS